MSAPTVFYTRLGIGVFDRLWWEYRLRLFEAVTFPSVSRLVPEGGVWFLFVDDDMPDEYREWVLSLADSVPAVEVVAVQFHFDVFARLHELLASRCEEVILVRVDDDDALASDYLEQAAAAVPRNTVSSLVCLVDGLEASVADWRARPYSWHWGSCNVIYKGPVGLVEKYALTGHHRLHEWAGRYGVTAKETSGGEPAFLYARHRQSDSSYGTTRRQVLDDPQARVLTAADAQRFGIEVDKRQQWAAWEKAAPRAKSSTWRIGADIIAAANRPGADRAALKRDLIAAKVSFLES